MSGLFVVCLCAEWCNTCRDYHPQFEALSREFPAHRFVWIDIEEESDLVANIDIENFPTLLIAKNDTPLFAGVMLPHIGRLRRMLQAFETDTTPARLPAHEFAEYRALIQHLHGIKT